MGHWGTHDGGKSVMQKGVPFSIHDERNVLLGAIGPGYEIFQSENKLFDVYVKGLVGYGVRSSRYGDYYPSALTMGRLHWDVRRIRKG